MGGDFGSLDFAAIRDLFTYSAIVIALLIAAHAVPIYLLRKKRRQANLSVAKELPKAA
jgi:hypothetical protein